MSKFGPFPCPNFQKDMVFQMWGWPRFIDNNRTLEKIKMIHMLAKQGARWVPNDPSEIAEARRSLLRMRPDYTVEFIWIMSKYNACKREDIEELILTSSIRSLVSTHMTRINELMKDFQTTQLSISPK